MTHDCSLWLLITCLGYLRFKVSSLSLISDNQSGDSWDTCAVSTGHLDHGRRLGSVSCVVLQRCPHFILIMVSPFIPALMREAWPNNILKASLTFKVGLKIYWQVNKRSDNWDLSLNNISNSSCGHNTTAPHQCVLCGCCCGDSCVVAALFNSNHNSQCKYQTVRGQNTRNDLIIDYHWLMQDLRTHLNIFSLNFTLMGHWTQHCQSSEDWFIDSSQNIESASGLLSGSDAEKQRIIWTSTKTHAYQVHFGCSWHHTEEVQKLDEMNKVKFKDCIGL